MCLLYLNIILMPKRHIWVGIFWSPTVSKRKKSEVWLKRNNEIKPQRRHEDGIRDKGRKCGSSKEDQVLFLRNGKAREMNLRFLVVSKSSLED